MSFKNEPKDSQLNKYYYLFFFEGMLFGVVIMALAALLFLVFD